MMVRTLISISMIRSFHFFSRRFRGFIRAQLFFYFGFLAQIYAVLGRGSKGACRFWPRWVAGKKWRYAAVNTYGPLPFGYTFGAVFGDLDWAWCRKDKDYSLEVTKVIYLEICFVVSRLNQVERVLDIVHIIQNK